MHIRKFDRDFSRREFMQKVLGGSIATAGILSPLWPLIAKAGDISKAYPEELLSIDNYTKGKISTGDILTADNVDLVKELLSPIAYKQVKEMGRRIKIVPTTTDVTQLYPHEYLEATLSNQGKAILDANGNVMTKEGKPWIGGNPFPDAKTPLETFSNLTLSWGRHNNAIYPIRDWDVGPDGEVAYQYDLAWVEENTTCRTGPGGPYLEGHEDKLRYNTVLFTAPSSARGTAYLSTWHYDQREFPDLVGYVPAFKRVRRFPTNQRFEPLIAGMTFYLSDAWAAGDPMLTWGDYEIVARKPMLGASSQNWHGDEENWEPPVHGGPKGETFFDTSMELIPEVIVIDAKPTGFPRAPVSRKRVYLDARNMMYVGYMTYDRRGELWKSFEPTFSKYEKGDKRHTTDGHTTWSWTKVHCHDIQTNRMTRFCQAESIAGGVTSGRNVDGLYEKYLTTQALKRLGA
jgi:hypothetical protein